MTSAANKDPEKNGSTTVTFAVNIVSVQLAWLACAYGAVIGEPAIGVFTCLIAIGVNIALSDDRLALSGLTLLLGLYGFLTESILTYSSAIEYRSPGPSQAVAPLWIVTLWMAFAGLIHPTFRWLVDRPAIAAVLGATMAPWSYYAASRLGVLDFSLPIAIPLLAISAQWAVALPAAIQIRAILSKRQLKRAS